MAQINYAQGVSLSDIFNNNLTNIEIEAMSQDLPEKIEIEVLGNFQNIFGNLRNRINLKLIPKQWNITMSDIFCFKNDFNWCAFRNYQYCDLKINEIPTEYNYFNVLLNCCEYGKITDFKMIVSDSSGIVMNFHSFSIESMIVFHLGVLAKTDNGTWKLYPKFQGYEKDFYTLLNDKNSFLYK